MKQSREYFGMPSRIYLNFKSWVINDFLTSIWKFIDYFCPVNNATIFSVILSRARKVFTRLFLHNLENSVAVDTVVDGTGLQAIFKNRKKVTRNFEAKSIIKWKKKPNQANFKFLFYYKNCLCFRITPFFCKERIFSTQPQCCLSMIIMRHFLYLPYLCPCLNLVLFISYLFHLLHFLFHFLNKWSCNLIKTNALVFLHIFRTCPFIFGF